MTCLDSKTQMEDDTSLTYEVLLFAYQDVLECFGLSKSYTAEAIEDVLRCDESPYERT